jgi:hypothetical protein
VASRVAPLPACSYEPSAGTGSWWRKATQTYRDRVAGPFAIPGLPGLERVQHLHELGLPHIAI